MRTYTPKELKKILELHVKWLEGKTDGERANLAEANLAGAYLEGTYLEGAYLAGAYLARANLAGANLTRANLAGAYLAGANLAEANLARANLTGAYLEGAYLVRANLVEANLAEANLARAYLTRANLAGANLAEASGNNKEIKTIQADLWIINYTESVIQIGCKNYTIEEWFDFSDEIIKKMDAKALEFWKKWKPILELIGVFDKVKAAREAK